MMKYLKLLLTVLLVGLALASPGWAHGGGHHHGHARVGVFIGAPLWPWYYPAPYYYPPPYAYPPVVTVPAAPPPVYVEQASPPQATQNSWYYCSNPDGYYPYVK